jgi:hypothetical protein
MKLPSGENERDREKAQLPSLHRNSSQGSTSLATYFDGVSLPDSDVT